MGFGYQQFSLKRHLINSSQLQCEKSLKFCDPVIWNSIIVQSDCSPRELSAKSIGIAFPKKVPERARSNFITKEHSKVITFIITFLNCLKSSHFITSAITFSLSQARKNTTGNWKTDNILPHQHCSWCWWQPWCPGQTVAVGVTVMTIMWQSCDNHGNRDNPETIMTIMWQSWQSWQSWPGQAVTVGVTMYILSISELSEVQMVSCMSVLPTGPAFSCVSSAN